MTQIPKLIAERLRTQPQGPHPEPDVLSTFAENALARDERRQVLAHLSTCAECREVIYLAQPASSETTPAIAFKPSRATWQLWRWTAVAAALVIVMGGVFLAKHELINNRQTAAKQAPVHESYAKISDDKIPADLDAVHNQPDIPVARKAQVSSVTSERLRPEAKHMTAKPQAEMRFEENGQVKLVNPSSRDADMVAAGSGAREGNQIAAKEDQISAKKVPATPAPTSPVANTPITGRNVFDEVTVTGASESVEVSAEAPQVANSAQVSGVVAANQNSQAQISGEKTTELAKDETAKSKSSMASAFSTQPALGASVMIPPAQWMITTAGEVRRSFDHGKTWQNVIVGNGANFHAVFSSGRVVWAGGNAGALYRSTDSGLNWTQVTPAAGGQKLISDIVHIEFSDSMNGRVSAANGEVWLTSDGGQSWRKK